MAEFDPNSFLEQEKSSEFNPDSFLEQEGVKKKESTELSSGLPQYVAAPKSTSESGSGVLGGIEQIAPKIEQHKAQQGEYVVPEIGLPLPQRNLISALTKHDNLVKETEQNLQQFNQIDANINELKKAQFNPQYNQQDALNKISELAQQKEKLKPILLKQNSELDQIAKQVDYFQSRLEKPQTKENDIADEVASVLYSFNKSVSDNVVTPIAGAINLMEDLESGGGIFKKPNRTLSKTVGDVSKYYDKVSEENQPQTIVGKTAAATASAIPLIALTTMTGAGTLPFVIGGQKALTEYGNEPNKPMSLKAEEATEALGEGIKEGLEIEASMMVGGAFGKAVSQELNLGKWGSATARGVGVGAAFALPDFAKVAVENKSLDAPDKEETFVSFATGLAFEAPKFFGLIKNAVSENKVERAAKIQNLDIYNTVFSAPLEAVSEAVEIPQSSELIYKRASSFLKKENPTNEDKIAFQALTRTAGVKDLVDVIISNPEKAKEQISSSDLTPEQKSEFRKRITEINQYFNPIEVRKTELSDEIELAQKTLSDLPEPQTPIDRAENAVLTEKLQETIKKSEQELTDLVRGQIDEAMNPKVEKDGNINLEQQVEPTPPVKIEGVGEGAEAEATKESELKKLEDELAINLAKAEKESDAKPIIKTKRADGTIDTNSIRENAIQAANSLYEYGVKRVNEKYAAQEVKPKTESPESGSVGVGGDMVEPKKQNFTQFAKENGYPDDYDTSFQAQLLGGRGLEGKRQSNRSIKEQDDAFQEMQNKKAEGKKAYEQAILEGKVIDPDGKLTREGILKRDYNFNKKELESKIANAQSGIKNIEGLGKMAHLDNGKLKKGYQRAVDDYNETIEKHKQELDKLKNEYEQSLKETTKAQAKVVATKEEAGGVGVGGDVESIKTIKQLESENKTTLPKIPTKNVFSNDVENLTKEQRGNADNFIGTEKENELPIETISIKDIVPTQKNLTIPNLEEVSKIKYGTKINEPIILIKKDGKYYVVDGHHRIANEILKGNTNVEAKVYNEQSLKETPKAGSVGVGGDVKIKYGGADKDLKGNPQKQWMKPAETSEQTTNRLAEFVEASDYKGREQSAFIDRGGESVEVKLRNDDGKWNWYYPKSKKPFASFNTAKEAITFIQEQPFWDNGELNKSGRNDDYFAKVKAAQVKAELENGNIIEDINDGKISAKDAKIIIESAGLEVPKDIAEQTLKETTKAETPSSSELPNNSKEPIKGKTDYENPAASKDKNVESKENGEGENQEGSNDGDNEVSKGRQLFDYLTKQGQNAKDAALNVRLFALNAKRRAQILGKSVREVLDEYQFGDESKKDKKSGLNNETGTRGSWSKDKGKRLLNIYKNAKNKTLVHEVLGHDYLDTIIEASKGGHAESSADIEVIVREFKKQNKTSKTEKQLYDALNNFNVESIDRKVDADAISVHEWFAKAAEKYMANPDMKGISPRLKRLFDKFITYLKDLHNDLAGTQVSEPMREIFRKAFGDEFDNAQKIIDEIDSDLAQRINNDSSEDALFSDIDTDFVEGENELNSIDLPQRTKDVLLTAARKLFEKGATSSTIIAQMKAKAANTPRSEAKINEIIDSLSKEIQAQGEFEFDGKFLPRAGAEKMLENENIPAELRAYIRKNKNVRGYKPTTIAEMDAMADIIISHLGEDAAADWATTLDKKDSKFASPQYKARVYKKITDSLYEKYIKLKETDAEKAEDVYDKYIKIVRDGLKSQTETAQLLASYRGVNGWGEFTVRDAEREIAKENAGKISKASTTFKQIAEAFKKKDEAINELMEKNFALEESLEAKSDKIAELESEQKTRTSKDRPLTNGTPKFSNPTEKKAELIAKLKASRASKGLKDEDSDNLKDYARVIMEEAKNTFSFSKFSKLARKDVGDFTDLELREAYESARDEMINDGFDDKFDNSEIIDKLIEENIVRDEDLKAKIEAKRLEKEAAQALKEWEIFEKEMAQKNKKTASEENRERILEKKYLDAEKRRLEKEAKSEQSLFNKSASTRIKQAKADVLEELKSAGYKKGNSVDWAKIAVERQQNPKEVERIIIETINKAKGLTVNEKNNLKQELLTKLDESIKESQRKKVEQALKDNGAKNTNNKGDIDKIVELVNSSPNAKEADIVKAFEKLFNIKSLPKKDAQRILELGKALQEETMRKERKKIIDEMTFLATKHSGSRIGRIIMDGMYASKLSGWLTQIKNATNRLNVWEQVIGSLARSGDRNYYRVLAKSRKRGIFGDTVNSGISLSKSTVGTDRYGNSTHVNELEHLADTPKWFRNTYGQQKYVGRFLDAIDGENWLRALDQSQYKYMVRQLKTKGYSDKAARNKAFEIMYPISEKEATESAQKYFSDKGQNIVGDNELKRAAYDIMRQNRESKAESLGISNLDKVGEMFADLLTFKGDAVGGTGDKKSFELSMWAASHVKGGFEAMNKYADKSGKIPKAVSALIKFEMAPFIDGIARIMERSAESALFGVGGFAKGMYQKNFAKSLDAGEGKILAEMQAEETLTRATGTLIMQIAATASIVYLNKLLLSAMGEEEDPEKNGFKGSRLFGKKSDEQKPGDVLMLLNGRVNIPFEYMGTLMLSAGLVGNIMDYTKSEDATASGVVLNTVNTALGASMFGSESKSLNWLKEIEKASKENGTFSEATHKALERQTAQLVTDFIPFRSFVKQTSDLYNNATDKESRSVLDNVLKYTISGYGLDDKIDYRGRLIKMGKKYPGGASGLREAFNESQYDDWDKLIGELGDMDFSQRPIDKITQFKMPLTDKEYYEYTKDVKTEFGNQLTDKKYFEIIKMKADKENHKSAEEVQRDAVNDIFKEAKKTIDKRFKIKNEWGEDFY